MMDPLYPNPLQSPLFSPSCFPLLAASLDRFNGLVRRVGRVAIRARDLSPRKAKHHDKQCHGC